MWSLYLHNRFRCCYVPHAFVDAYMKGWKSRPKFRPTFVYTCYVVKQTERRSSRSPAVQKQIWEHQAWQLEASHRNIELNMHSFLINPILRDGTCFPFTVDLFTVLSSCRNDHHGLLRTIMGYWGKERRSRALHYESYNGVPTETWM